MIGQVFSGRYELVEETDAGPVYETFRSKEKLTGKDCTLRIIKAEIAQEPGFLPELRSVVEEASRVTHPSLEHLMGVLSDQNKSFILSEFTPGTTLEDRVKRLSAFSVPVAVATVIDVAEAVSALHAAGIIHGDLSAKTVMSTSADTIKVCVPGLWRAYGNSTRAAVSALRSMAPYLAPEVTAGGMPSPQSDIYATGVLLWQLLTGRLPYPGETPSAIAVKQSTAPYPSLRLATNSVPMPLDKIVEKAMAKDPSSRYRNIEEMLRDLRLLSDALRFGKPLTWPLLQGEGQSVDRVVPEMNVANPRSGKDVAKKKRREDSDGVPGWLQGIAYVAVGAAVMVLAAWFFFNMHRPLALHTPNLVGKSQLEAMQDLEKMGLKMRRVREETSEKYGEGIVVGQTPTVGEDVLEHSYVEVVVSSGSKYVTVPALKGKTVDESKELLKAINLDVSDQMEFVPNSDYERGFVVGQVPDPESKVPRYSKVKLQVASGQRSETPASSERYLLTVTVKNVDSPVLVRVDLSDERGTRTVHEDTHDPNSKFKVSQRGYGDNVEFKVYYDNVLVKTVRPPKPTKSPDDGAPPPDTPAQTDDTGGDAG